MAHSTTRFVFDNSYARELDGLYAENRPEGFADASMVAFNEHLAADFGFDVDQLVARAASELSGTSLPDGSTPISLAYAGHQFGSFSGLLGDGRAILLGEILNTKGMRFDIQLKGAGRTAFSRGGDGRCALGPALREYLVSEAMHALGVPTTRVLAVLRTGETIRRRSLHPGAVLTRIASSHIRVGSFELFASLGDNARLKRLADYCIRRHFPHLIEADIPYLSLVSEVGRVQGELVAKWMLVGFVHGVMNTDNVAVSGETLDYGPCAFMDRYDSDTVFSSVDRGGRYSFSSQPEIGRWNNERFASAIYPLLVESPPADWSEGRIRDELLTLASLSFVDSFEQTWRSGICAKMGLDPSCDADVDLVNSFLDLLEEFRVDYTKAFRKLSEFVRSGEASPDGFHSAEKFAGWLAQYSRRMSRAGNETADGMDRLNPLYIPRNHLVEAALQDAERGELESFFRLLAAVREPFVKASGSEFFEEPAAEDAEPYRTFCGT